MSSSGGLTECGIWIGLRLCGRVQSSVDKSIAEMMAYKFDAMAYTQAIHYTYMFSAIYLWCRRCLYSWCSMPQRHLLYLFFFFGLKSQGAAHYQQIELPVFSPIFPLHFFFLLLCVFLFLFFVKSFLLLFLPSLCAMTSETSRAAGRTCIHSPTIYQFSRGIQC